MKNKKTRIAVLLGSAFMLLGAVSCARTSNVNSPKPFEAKAMYALKTTNAGSDELTEISYLKSVGYSNMLLATGFNDSTLSKANALAAELETQATLGYVVNGVKYESNKYYDGISTSNEGSDNKIWTAQDIFGATEKTHMIVSEIPMGETTDFTVNAYIKVGDNIVAEQSRDIKAKAKVYAEKDFDFSFSYDKGQESVAMEGAKVGQKDHETYPSDIMPDDLVRITYLFNFTEFKDLDTQVNLLCKSWYESQRTRGTEVETCEKVTLSFAESGIKLGKVALSFIVKVPGTFATTTYRLHPLELYPMVGFSSGVSGKFEKVIFSDPAGDLDYKIEGYYETRPVEFKTPFFGTYEKLLATNEYSFSCNTVGTDWSGFIQEPSFGGGWGHPIDLKGGDLVDVTIMLDVTEIGTKPEIWYVASSWEPREASEYQADMTGKLHTGKVAFTYSFCFPESYISSADRLTYPMFKFKDINCSSSKYIITSHNANLSEYIPQEYDILAKEEYILTGLFSAKEKIGLLGFGEYDNAQIGLGNWFEGRQIGGSGYDQVIVEDDLINIQYDFTLTDASKVKQIKFECGSSYTTWNGETINAGDSILLSQDEFNLKNGHIILSFTLKIPANFVYNQNVIYPRIVLIGDTTGDIIGTAKRVIFNRDGYDMSMFTGNAEMVLDYEMKTTYFGTFPKVSKTIDISWYTPCDCEQGVWSGNFENVYFAGRNPTEIANGDKYQITYLLNIEEIKDANAKIRTTPRTWFSGTPVTSSEEVLCSAVGLNKVGKVAFTYVVQLNGEYNSNINELDSIMNFYGLKLSFSQIIATKYGTDLSKVVPSEYQVLTPHVITSGYFAVSGN